MGTFKTYLTEEQWARACKADKEVAAEVQKQQPEMFARLAPAKTEVVDTATDRTDEKSPVADKPAPDAIEAIGNMRSKDRLQSVIDHDPRVTVQEAAKARLAEIESA